MSELAYLFCGKSNSTLLTLLLVTTIGIIGNFQWNLRKYAQLESAMQSALPRMRIIVE